MTTAKKYPIPSWTGSCPTHMGTLYVTVTHNDKLKVTGDYPVQMLLGTIGGTNSCMRSEVEAISRLTNIALDHGAELPEIIDQLSGIKCEPIWDQGRQVYSPADAFAKILQQFMYFSDPEYTEPVLGRE